MKKKEAVGSQDTTDLTLFVRTSDEDVARWNRQRIVDALIRETDIDSDTADSVSREVEKQIMTSGIGLLTTTLIRELVDAKLIERGLEHARGMHARLGFPLYDVGQLILHPNRGNANLPHNPEATNLILAEGIKRAYGLHEVFSRDVGDAHTAGDLHVHALGYIDRPYSICSSLEYIKKFGMNLPHSVNVAGPARHGDVLLAHMVRYAAILQGHFSGVVAWHAVNLFFAPYLVGMTDEQIRQLAQMLVYEFAQLASATGGQSIFTDIHLYWEVPDYLADVPAMGPGGRKNGQVLRRISLRVPALCVGPLRCLQGRRCHRETFYFSPADQFILRMPFSGRPVAWNFSTISVTWRATRAIPFLSLTGEAC